MELRELLESGDVAGFNAARPEHGKMDLFAGDFAEKSLVGVDLSGANADKSDFTGADLSDATLMGTSMSGIDGTGMKLVNALGMKLRLKEAWLDESDLSEADLSRSNLKGAVLERSVGTGVVLVGAKLAGVNAKGANWTDAELIEASLHGADFTGADLSRSNFSECSGSECILTEARLDGVLGTHARLPGANLVGASLSGARLLGANLAGANLSNADLSNADLSQANLTDAVLEGANLSGAVLTDACLDGVVLTSVDVTGADLTGVDPTSLGLTAEQRESLVAVGVTVPEDAPIAVRGAMAAWNGSTGLAVWENQDGEEAKSLRFALFGDTVVLGVLPAPAEMVVARAVHAHADGFSIAVLRDRPGGVALGRYRVSMDGEIVASETANLGYEPMVWPVFGVNRRGDELLYGIARRGPTLVVHGPGEQSSLAAVNSARVPTAVGFIGRHHPVLSCKGDVVMPAGPAGAGQPKRTPEGFPGRTGTAVPSGDRLLCVWLVDRVGSRRGGVHYAWLERRGAPETEVLSQHDALVSLDAVGDEDGAWVVWVELTSAGGVAMRCRLPDGAVEPIAPQADAVSVSLAPSVNGAPGAVVTSSEGQLYLVDSEGKVREM